MRARLAVVTAAVLLIGSAAGATADDGGWGYLMDKLVADGVKRERVIAVFRDPRVPEFDGLEFSLYARETGQGMALPEDSGPTVDDEPPTPPTEPGGDEPAPPRRGGHLRIVK